MSSVEVSVDVSIDLVCSVCRQGLITTQPRSWLNEFWVEPCENCIENAIENAIDKMKETE